jgi:hypothetical protein
MLILNFVVTGRIRIWHCARSSLARVLSEPASANQRRQPQSQLVCRRRPIGLASSGRRQRGGVNQSRC